MKSLFTILCCLSALSTVSAQQTPVPGTAQPSRKLPRVNIFQSSRYTMEVEVLQYGTFRYTIRRDEKESDKKEFTIVPNSYENFYPNFVANYTALAVDNQKTEPEFQREASRIYYFFVAADITAGTLNNQPKAGSLHITRKVNIVRDLTSRVNRKQMKTDIKSKLKDARVKNSFPRRKYTIDKNTMLRKDAWRHFAKKWEDEQNVLKDSQVGNIQTSICETADKIASIQAELDIVNRSLQDETAKLNALNETMIRMKTDLRLKFSRTWSAFEAGVDLMRTDKLLIFSGTIIPIDNTIGPDVSSLAMDKKALADIYNQIMGVASGLQNPEKDILLQLSKDQAGTSAFQPYAVHLAAQNITDIDVLQSRMGATKNRLSDISTRYKTFVDEKLRLNDSKWDASVETAFPTFKKEIDDVNKIVDDVKTQQLAIKNFKYEETITATSKRLKEEQGKIDENNRKASEIALTKSKHTFIIDNIQFEFNEGYLENIVVFGRIADSEFECANGQRKNVESNDAKMKFVNISPLGFSRKMDYSLLKKENLFSIGGDSHESYTMNLRDVLPTYVEELEVDRRDFSPGDQKVTVAFRESEEMRVVELTKVATKKLFEARVYNDFLGIADPQSPNGIIQTEVDKRLNLVTHRHRWTWFEHNRINSGIFEYIEPGITISKIESNNKNLVLNSKDRFIGGLYMPLRYASTLDFRRHEKFSAGFDLNVLLFDITGIKSTIRINGGMRYGRVGVIDSLKEPNAQGVLVKTRLTREFDANTWRVYPKVVWDVLTDGRVGFRLSYAVHWYFTHHNYFEQVANVEQYENTGVLAKRRRIYNQAQLLLTYQPNGKTDNKLFLRLNHFWQQGFWNTTFSQLQVGYSFYITRNLNAE